MYVSIFRKHPHHTNATMNSGELKVEDVPLASVESDMDDDLESNHSDSAAGRHRASNSNLAVPGKQSRSASASRTEAGAKASQRFNLDGDDSVAGSLEDLVNSFDDKLTKVFQDYQEQVENIAPVQVSAVFSFRTYTKRCIILDGPF